MSTFGNNNSRRGPNVSQYLRNLNMQETTQMEETFISDEDLQKELAMFTNTQFFDFDSGQNTDYQQPPPKPDTVDTTELTSPTEDGTAPDAFMTDFSSLEFMSGDFNYGEFGSSYTTPTIPTFPDHLGGLQPIQPSPQQGYPAPPVQQAPSGYGAQAPLVPGDKRPSDVSSHGSVMNFEEQTRRLAEEDKRRRNTAASARFRIKKKQREQALEKSAKEMTDKMTALENRIATLETENKWLRSLVMDKHVDTHGKDELAKLLSLDKDELSRLLKELEVAKNDKSDTKDGEVSPSKAKKVTTSSKAK